MSSSKEWSGPFLKVISRRIEKWLCPRNRFQSAGSRHALSRILHPADGRDLAFGEFKPRAGSAPLVRFLLGMCAMIGALVFLGCPWRALLRLAGGDLNAVTGLAGLIAGVGVGSLFFRRGYSLGRSAPQRSGTGLLMPLLMLGLLALYLLFPQIPDEGKSGIIFYSVKGPGSMHAPLLYSLIGAPDGKKHPRGRPGRGKGPDPLRIRPAPGRAGAARAARQGGEKRTWLKHVTKTSTAAPGFLSARFPRRIFRCFCPPFCLREDTLRLGAHSLPAHRGTPAMLAALPEAMRACLDG